MKKALHTAAEMEGTWKRLLHKSQKMKNKCRIDMINPAFGIYIAIYFTIVRQIPQ